MEHTICLWKQRWPLGPMKCAFGRLTFNHNIQIRLIQHTLNVHASPIYSIQAPPSSGEYAKSAPS